MVIDSLNIVTLRPARVKVLLGLLEAKDFLVCQRMFTTDIPPIALPLYCGDAALANW